MEYKTPYQYTLPGMIDPETYNLISIGHGLNMTLRPLTDFKQTYIDALATLQSTPATLVTKQRGVPFAQPNPEAQNASLTVQEAYLDWVDNDDEEMKQAVSQRLAGIADLDDVSVRQLIINKRLQLLDHAAINALVSMTATEGDE